MILLFPSSHGVLNTTSRMCLTTSKTPTSVPKLVSSAVLIPTHHHPPSSTKAHDNWTHPTTKKPHTSKLSHPPNPLACMM